MFLWQKLASAEWLRHHETAVPCRADTRLALIDHPGRSLIAVEVACKTEKEARELRKAFGGDVEKIRKDWLRAYARAQRRPPLRIAKRLLVSAEPVKKCGNVRQLIIPAGTAFGTGEHPTTPGKPPTPTAGTSS